MRWFGPHDPVSLMNIRQAGCTGVVTALHHIPVGEVWPMEAIRERIALVEADNERYSPLRWVVVESLPVHEDIKKGLPQRERRIKHYVQSLRHLSACGIRTVCYNFMPVLDWSRTDLNFEMPDGARALRFVWEDFAVFDIHILCRPGAENDYSEAVRGAAAAKFGSMSQEEATRLRDTILLGLPGSEEAFELDSFQNLLDAYSGIGAEELRQNLHYFIQKIGPVAAAEGIRLCIHPDDPPMPLLGLPRVVSTELDIEHLMNAFDHPANGITFCTGSLGARPDNDLPHIARRFAARVHFLHLRSTKREENPLNFHEAGHLDGDVDMYSVLETFVQEEKRRRVEGRPDSAIPMRPDHGHQMLDDLNKKTYPGYSAIGRLRGLAELRGMERAISLRHALLLLILFCCLMTARADDGYRLWLKYDRIQNTSLRAEYLRSARFVEVRTVQTPIIRTAEQELKKGLEGLLGAQPGQARKSGGIVLQKSVELPSEGFHIEARGSNIYISGGDDKGVLYGVFTFLRMLQTGQPLAGVNRNESPKVRLRMLNHWDNPLGTIERGYAGASLWKWYELPETIDPRYRDYARANASIGINATVLNNVNASTRFLTDEYLVKVKALADVFRPYGIQVFLSINFASPKILGKLDTSDPMDPRVQEWWNEKTKEIYCLIPDFGGFLVKANSEGEPGPQEHGRTHADGANMLARALQPHGGMVIWRAFVYSPDPQGDRFREAYNEFKPLDGTFDKNVVLQVKNGPIDFQPREPFHPLFGAMPQTPPAMEFQITQEYLGFSTHLVYLASLFKECLQTDTYAAGKGSTVAKVIDGSLYRYPITVMAGVANTGSDRNWTGHLMSQVNWYAFGRLAWNHELSEAQIAAEWIKMTWTQHPPAEEIIAGLLLQSWQTYIDFTTPLGLHHIMGQNIHFGPEPWLAHSARPDWTSVYYHRADSMGIGFNRTASGSKALSLYHPEVQARWGHPETCDLDFLLWFHYVRWDKKLSTGRTLWDELCHRYYSGAASAKAMQEQWRKVRPYVDAEMYEDVNGRLAAQYREALNWRDACVLYFQTFSKQPVPAPWKQPERTLDDMKRIVEIYQLR